MKASSPLLSVPRAIGLLRRKRPFTLGLDGKRRMKGKRPPFPSGHVRAFLADVSRLEMCVETKKKYRTSLVQKKTASDQERACKLLVLWLLACQSAEIECVYMFGSFPSAVVNVWMIPCVAEIFYRHCCLKRKKREEQVRESDTFSAAVAAIVAVWA